MGYKHRKDYYQALEQSKVMDITPWISASQYQKVAKVSKATATRHLTDLLQKKCIEKLPGSGRSTRYRLAGGERGE